MVRWIEFFDAVDTTYRDKRGEPLNPDEPQEEWRYEEPKRSGEWTLIKQDRDKSVCLEKQDGYNIFGWIMTSNLEQKANHSIAQGACGKILMAGLGVGWEAFFLNDDSHVETITIVEKDLNIITLSSPVLSHKEKVTIKNDTILHFMQTTRNKYDTIYFDVFPANPIYFPEEVKILTDAAQNILNEHGKILFWNMYRPLEL